MTVSTDGGGARLTGLLRMAAWGGAGLLMLAPVVAELTVEEMAWSPGDFVVWGAMLLTACGGFELAMRMSSNWAYRAGAVVAIGAGFLLVWISLAVGIIGSENDIANSMYAGVLAMGVVGAVLARFRSLGLARTLFSMAIGTVLIGAVTLIAGWGSESESWPQVIIVLNGVFATAWLLSGWLFLTASRQLARAAA